MEKAVLDRRLGQLEAEGVEFRCGVVGRTVTRRRWAGRRGARRRRWSPPRHSSTEFDAVVLAGGATPAAGPAGARARARGHPPGHGLPEAVQHRPRRPRSTRPPISAAGEARGHHRRRRHRCRLPRHRAPPGGRSAFTSWRSCRRRPTERTVDNPWPTWPLILRSSAAHEEGGERVFSVTTTEFVGRRQRTGRRAPLPAGRDRDRRGRAAALRRDRGLRRRAALPAGPARLWASSVRSGTARSPSSVSSSTRGEVVAVDSTGRPTSRASSSAAT